MGQNRETTHIISHCNSKIAITGKKTGEVFTIAKKLMYTPCRITRYVNSGDKIFLTIWKMKGRKFYCANKAVWEVTINAED